jgi:hypothetical protein
LPSATGRSLQGANLAAEPRVVESDAAINQFLVHKGQQVVD